MTNLIQKIALALALVATGAGIATPIAYQSGRIVSQDKAYSRGEKEGYAQGSMVMLNKCQANILELARYQAALAKERTPVPFKDRAFILAYEAYRLPFHMTNGKLPLDDSIISKIESECK